MEDRCLHTSKWTRDDLSMDSGSLGCQFAELREAREGGGGGGEVGADEIATEGPTEGR